MDKPLNESETRSMAAAAIPFAPNVKLAGDAEPLGAGPITVGMRTLSPLPDADAQKEGFYFKDARLLVQLFPDRFKLIVEKGR